MQMVRREVVPVLTDAGYEVDLAEASMRKPLPLDRKPYRLLLFDVGAKCDIDYQLCAQARMTSDLPVMLMLRGAARNEILRGYQAGADAYVLVPFDPRELLARLEALLKRASAPAAQL
jgi:DNA-binding response OmpR family regulator